ncbi:uncharacterized protein LOC142505626 [Primulina tabacum]|uniref:uncharacterized protein LOC142505626 n=1 Tax=Primulina tabacum TaxID=48773 RepID=UPI003F59EF62
MLLRSYSSTVLNSWLPQKLKSEPEFSVRVIPKSRSLHSIKMSSVSFDDRSKKMAGIASETDLKEIESSRPINSDSYSNLHGFLSITDDEEEDYVGGGGGRRLCGGGSGGSGFRDSNGGSESMEIYYQEIIAADPGNSMILSNYARFLKEI